ncbi:hypothetical protein FWC31_03005 [Candidatus Saccharibacteria bacterium]|nr:hypothetical protein [Candidatus Saccharibacteria bacterium]
MAWGGQYSSDDRGDEAPDYSSPRDYSDTRSKAPANREELYRDLLGDNYDKFDNLRGALGKAEKSAGGESDKEKSPRDIAKQEREGKQLDWLTNMIEKRDAAIAASQNKQSGFFARHKKGIIGWLIGIVVAGGMSIFMLPAIAVAEFGQMANWLKDTTQTVHELVTGARTMRNVVRSATVAARSAVSTAVHDHFQTSRVGAFGQMVGKNYVNKLADAGITIKSSNVFGTFESIEINYATLIGDDNWKLVNYEELPAGPERTQAQWNFENQVKPQIESTLKSYGLNEIVDISPSGKISTNGRRLSHKELLNALRTSGRASGGSVLGTEIKVRKVSKMLGSYSWFHPIEKLKGLGLDKIEDFIITREIGRTKQAKNNMGAEKVVGDDGNSIETPEATNQIAEAELHAAEAKAGKTRLKITKALKIAGAGAAIAGVIMIGLCSIQAAGDAHKQNMLGLEQTGTSIYQEPLSTWGQIQASFMGLDGDAIDFDVLGVLRGEFLYSNNIPDDYEVDDNFNITKVNSYRESSWTDSSKYQETINGVVIADNTPDQVKNMYKEAGGWAAELLTWLNSVGAGGLFNGLSFVFCNDAAQFLMDVVGSLDPVGLITTVILKFNVLGAADAMASLMAWAFQIGQGIAYDKYAYDHGQNANTAFYFGKHNAMTSFASSGAGELSPSQAYENQLAAQEWLEHEWTSRPLAERLFDASDYRSTIARVVNSAKINTMPSGIQDYFANFAKLVGAVPNFVLGGLFNNRSTQALAAVASISDINAPTIEMSQDQMATITGDFSYDWDVNFYGCGVEDIDDNGNCTIIRVSNNVKKLLDGDSNNVYRNYAKYCLGYEIGSESDGYIVRAFETNDPNEARLVGMKGGRWEGEHCNERVTTDINRDSYFRIGLYAGMDYPILQGYAWYSASDSPEDKEIEQQIARELEFISTGSTSSTSQQDDNLGEYSTQGIKAAFDALGGTYTRSSNNYTFRVNINGCTTIPAWFIDLYTDLTYGGGDGRDVAKNLVSNNSGLELSSTPRALAIFSTTQYNSVSYCGNEKCGHTGLVLSVDGDNITILETGAGFGFPKNGSWSAMNTLTADQWKGKMDFVYIGDHLK